eukprot:2000071-Rhodomonas_salina.1
MAQGMMSNPEMMGDLLKQVCQKSGWAVVNEGASERCGEAKERQCGVVWRGVGIGVVWVLAERWAGRVGRT